ATAGPDPGAGAGAGPQAHHAPRPGVGPGAAHPRHVEVGRNPEGGVMADATFADQAAATAAEDAEAEAILADAVSRDDDDDPEGADQLGDPGKRALQRMKEELKRERARRKEAERRAAEAAKKRDDDPTDVEEVRRRAREEALAEAARERVTDRIEALAARRFADPEDAVAILLRRREVDDFLDGTQVDVDAIKAAREELAEDKPHLLSAPPVSNGRFDTGRGKRQMKAQLTQEDLRGMTPEQINQARREGRLDRLMGR